MDLMDSLNQWQFKLNFNVSNIRNKSASACVFNDFNGTIKIVVSRHLGNASIIIAKTNDFKRWHANH